MSPAGFETSVPASEQRQTHALDCATTGIGSYAFSITNFNIKPANIGVDFIVRILLW